MQFGADRHPCGEPQVIESACLSASRGGDASVAGAGLYSHRLGRDAMTMQERRPGKRAAIVLEALLGIIVPPSQAVSVAQACLPNGILGGPLQMALVPAACVGERQRSIATGTCPSTSGVANLSQERRDYIYSIPPRDHIYSIPPRDHIYSIPPRSSNIGKVCTVCTDQPAVNKGLCQGCYNRQRRQIDRGGT